MVYHKDSLTVRVPIDLLHYPRWSPKTGHTWSPENRPIRLVARDVDADERHCSLRRYEQRIERRQKTTDSCTGAFGLAVKADRTGHWCAARNSKRLSQGSRDLCAATRRLGAPSAGKTGQRGDHRL